MFQKAVRRCAEKCLEWYQADLVYRWQFFTRPIHVTD